MRIVEFSDQELDVCVDEKVYPFDPIVFETWRPDQLQQIYFSQGTTKARSAIYGWHFYGLAVDFVSASRGWSVPYAWWDRLAELAERFSCKAGHRWRNPDNPHIYWGRLLASPSDRARELYFGSKHWQGLKVYEGEEHQAGLMRVWKEVRAA